MILEVATLNVIPGQEPAFEAAFRRAIPILTGTSGCISHELRRSIEHPGRYILRDNEKTEVIADSLLQPMFCLRAGVRHDATAPILPRAVAA